MFSLIQCIIFVIAGLPFLCQSNVVINIRIYNYQNKNDIKHDGWRCETFHWANDHCDPMFSICVTSQGRCDIYSDKIEHWSNIKFVNNVLSKSIKRNHMQKSFLVEVQVDDKDHDHNDHIAFFKAQFEISKLNHVYATQMGVKPSGIQVHLYASIKITCEEGYYGENCDVHCVPKPFKYNCNTTSGEKESTLDCGYFGEPKWNTTGDTFVCSCKPGFTGDQCQNSNFESCAKLNCNANCIIGKLYKYCNCKLGQKSEQCQTDLYTQPQVTTSRALITSTYKTTEKNYDMQPQVTTSRALITSTYKTTEKNYDNSKQLHATFQNSVSAATIVIICLLIILCICVVSLLIAVRNWRKKDIKVEKNGYRTGFQYHNPLPAVVYKPNLYNTSTSGTVSIHSRLPDPPNFDYDDCTVQTECQYESSLIRLHSGHYEDDRNQYEEPNQRDIMTFQTEIEYGDSDSEHYEVPRTLF